MLPNKVWVNMIGMWTENRNRRGMGCRCVYPAHIGVGGVYVVADARLACADQGKPDMGVGVAADLSALPADCGKCLGWKGWRRVVNILSA